MERTLHDNPVLATSASRARLLGIAWKLGRGCSERGRGKINTPGNRGWGRLGRGAAQGTDIE